MKSEGGTPLKEKFADADLHRGVVVVSHDAVRTGAPLIALNIARELVRGHGIPVVTLLRGRGELEPDFASLGPTFLISREGPAAYLREMRPWARQAKRMIHILNSGSRSWSWHQLTSYIRARQIQYAVCNTVLAGDAAVRLKGLGVRSIGLVHEMSHSIRSYGWSDQAAALVSGTEALVFACPQVRADFAGMFPLANKTTRIFPQGINIDPEQLSAERRAEIRTALRARLGLAAEDILVLGCGYGTFRKGVDLFVQAARETAASSGTATIGRIVFAWVGQLQPDFQAWAEKDVMELNLTDRLILPGPQQEMAPWFAAADIFFLSSREDPFPTVVLEAMASGLPVVGFSGTGGYEEQARGGAGLTVPYADVASAVRSLRRLAERPGERAEAGRIGRERVETWGGYSGYVRDLLHLLSAPRVKESEESGAVSLRGSGR